MKFEDVELFTSNPFELAGLTVVTASPQTSASWLVLSLVKVHGGGDANRSPVLSLEPTSAQIRVPPHLSTADLLVLQNLELPVLAGAMTADALARAVLDIASRVRKVVVVLTLSPALVNSYFDTGKELAQLATSLLYQAQLVLQLQPLATGRARDITGRLVVSRGPRQPAERQVLEREMHYFVNRKGHVDLT